MSRKKKHEHSNHERWLVSYADFITLLFAFFVVMFASSQSDQKKVKEAEFSIRSAFQTMGIFPAMNKDPNLGAAVGSAQKSQSQTIVLGDDLYAPPKAMADLKKMQQRMQQLLASQIAQGTVSVHIGRDGLVISLREAGFFPSAAAIPKRSSLPILNAIGNALAETPYNVRIEGHTDNVPIHNEEFASNWELSTARATELTRLFIERDHIAANRLVASGYAEYHPVASNSTAQGRSKNRRVDIIILPTQQQLSYGKSKRNRDIQKLLSKSADSAF